MTSVIPVSKGVWNSSSRQCFLRRNALYMSWIDRYIEREIHELRSSETRSFSAVALPVRHKRWTLFEVVAYNSIDSAATFGHAFQKTSPYSGLPLRSCCRTDAQGLKPLPHMHLTAIEGVNVEDPPTYQNELCPCDRFIFDSFAELHTNWPNTPIASSEISSNLADPEGGGRPGNLAQLRRQGANLGCPWLLGFERCFNFCYLLET